MKNKSVVSIAVGLVLAVIGVGIVGNAIFDWNFKLFIEGWWALALMIVFLALIIKEKPSYFNVSGLIIFGFVFLRHHIPALQKVDFWTLFAGIALIVIAVRLFFDKGQDNKNKNIEVEAEVKKTEDIDE